MYLFMRASRWLQAGTSPGGSIVNYPTYQYQIVVPSSYSREHARTDRRVPIDGESVWPIGSLLTDI